jgi:hypothetical protein
MNHLIRLGRCSSETKGAYASQLPDDGPQLYLLLSNGVMALAYCSNFNPEIQQPPSGY